MDIEDEARRYTEEPALLVDLCQQVLERLALGTGDEEAAQLKAVSAAIEQLQKQGIPVPDGLRAEKLRLADAQARSEEAVGKLRTFVDGLEQLVRPYFSKDRGQQESTDAPQVRRRSRGEAKVTDGATLRGLIIDILRSHGGSARVPEIIEEMAERLQGQLLPGDLELVKLGGNAPPTWCPSWQRRAHSERRRMVLEGLLRSDSPVGVWELTDQYK